MIIEINLERNCILLVLIKQKLYETFKIRGRNGKVGLATCYESDGTKIESRSGLVSCLLRSGPGAHPASYTMGTGSFLGVKRPRRSVNHLQHLAPRLKKEWRQTSIPIWVFMSCSGANFYTE